MVELIPPQEDTFHINELGIDPETGLLMYNGKFDQDTGTIMEPQLLFNSRPSAPSENHSRDVEKETTGSNWPNHKVVLKALLYFTKAGETRIIKN